MALNAIGWAAKQSALPNKAIPWILIVLGGMVYPFVYDAGDMILNVRNQSVAAALQGICIGGAAVGMFEATKIFKKDDPPQTVKPPGTTIQ